MIKEYIILYNEQYKPQWLKSRFQGGTDYKRVDSLLTRKHLTTVCQEAKCPNIWDCFSRQTATFLIMGNQCTRNCRFCAIEHGKPEKLDPSEPIRIVEAVKQLNLKYVVITSVTRDDLCDGGAHHFAETIHTIRNDLPDVLIEVLIPDFQGDQNSLLTVIKARPDVINHNIETVSRLYPVVCPKKIYSRSLKLLENCSQFDFTIPTKSGIMLGFGETKEEVESTLKDLLETGCRILTIGQYLRPSSKHIPVTKYVTRQEFKKWGHVARKMGFQAVASGAFVRSSFNAKELLESKIMF